MIMKVRVGTPITVAATVGVVAPAGADPAAFQGLRCTCPRAVPNDRSATDDVNQWLQDAPLHWARDAKTSSIVEEDS